MCQGWAAVSETGLKNRCEVLGELGYIKNIVELNYFIKCFEADGVNTKDWCLHGTICMCDRVLSGREKWC